jgi:virulence-associated protein VagC
MPYLRHVKLLRNGHHQVIRIPVEFELPGEDAMMHREGDRLVIEPLRNVTYSPCSKRWNRSTAICRRSTIHLP